MIPRIVATPIAARTHSLPAPGAPRAVAPAVLEATLPGPGRDRLAAGPTLAVTTGQQPGLFTGPLYTIYKALSAIALAARLERERNVPVVPVFWVAGDDHDFHEGNHATLLNSAGEPLTVVLRERPADAAAVPLYRERCGPEIAGALDQVRQGTPDSEFKEAVLDWLAAAYRPDATLADAAAGAIQALLGPLGLAVVRPYAASMKGAMAPLLVRALGATLDDGLSPVLIEAAQGRDRLRPEGDAFVTRRTGERFTKAELERIAGDAPQRLSPNVLLRPVIEAALLPTVAYMAGPGELEYFPSAAPLYRALDVSPQTALPRWSGILVEARVDKVVEKHGLKMDDFAAPPGAVEGRLVRDQLPPEVAETLENLKEEIRSAYGRVSDGARRVDPTLERTVESARNAALGGMQDIEKKIVAALKRANETLIGQLSRARAALFPSGQPQERVLTYASMAIRYGPALLTALADEVARWAAAS
ncbi:MAG TPA: bacillithiol biosynthesis BshC [Gemmatimonadales bacterium]|nr:bacillithiol biosynthesis BshC [Gemmatimonadales bacterium]